MQAYTGFARVYDTFMDNVPYDAWTEYLSSLLKEYGVQEGLVLELGCGTGSVTRRLSKMGYDMIGIDSSEEMLEIAREKEYEYEEYDYDEFPNEDSIDGGSTVDVDYDAIDTEWDYMEKADEYEEECLPSILYLNQDMREFELFGTVAAVVCICDGMNYITKEEDLLKVFKLVNNYLDPEGVFIFDLNTEYKYKHILGDNVIAENREECSFIWENFYDDQTKINEYQMTIFVKDEDDDECNDKFTRFRESHFQKAYSLEVIQRLLKEAGMEFITAYDAFTKLPPKENSERIYVIAREKYQEGKQYNT